MCTACLWNNLHQVRLNVWKPNNLNICGIKNIKDPKQTYTRKDNPERP